MSILLNHYSCMTLEELEKIDFEDKKYDISFLKGKITASKLSEILLTSITMACSYIDGKCLIDNKKADLLLKYYSCNTFDELKNKDIFDKKYDISFLKGRVSSGKLSEILFVSISMSVNYLSGKYKINDEQLLYLLNNYSCNTIEELKELNINEKNDISFLNKIMTSFTLSKILKVDRAKAQYYLKGKIYINWNQLLILLKYFSCNTIEELKEKVLIDSTENLKKEDNKNYKIIFYSLKNQLKTYKKLYSNQIETEQKVLKYIETK